MRFGVCKLEPKTPIHLGTKETILEDTSEYIHSDTLFSAICSAYHLLYGKKELEELLNCFNKGNMPFLISSAFPFIGDVSLFPLPRSINFTAYTEDAKKFKKVEFISEDIFREVTSGKNIDKHIANGRLLQGGKILASDRASESASKSLEIVEPENIRIWDMSEVPRVTIDRVTSQSNIFHFGEVIYQKSCGLFFLIRPSGAFKKEYERRIFAAIRMLADEGIGGDRTYGKGLFKQPKFDEITIETNSKDCFTTLSLYHPRRDEIPYVKDGYYEIVARGGWIYSLSGKSMRRRTVRMLGEGSVVGTHGEPHGHLVDVTPEEFKDHRIYRYGYSFPIPIEVAE